MSALAVLQDAFQGYLLRGEPALAEHICAASGEHLQRAAIYYDGYRSRLAEALAADFEALAAALGGPAFDQACRAYVEVTPSRFRSVRWYGSGLGAFLARTPPWSETPWLAELAQFEWALTLAFDAPDLSPITFEQLAALPPQAWATLVLELHPSVQVLALRGNAAALRQAADAGEPLPAPTWALEPSPWVVWREGASPHFRRVSPAEGWALRALSDRLDFPGLCEGLCKWTSRDEAPAQAAGLLRGWVDREMIGAARWADQ
jgi:hypothetical protein